MTTAAIIGSGIGGLSAAYYMTTLARPVFKKIVIIEASNRAGGWVKSIKNPANDCIHEVGPRSLRPGGLPGQVALQLVDELLLSDQVIYVPKDSEVTENSLIFKNNQLNNVPRKISQLFTSSPLMDRLPLVHVLSNLLKLKRDFPSDMPIYDFIKNQFGTDIAENVVDPFFRGITGGDIRELSARTCIPSNIYLATTKKGSMLRGMLNLKPVEIALTAQDAISSMSDRLCSLSKDWFVWSLRNGLESLIHTLVDYLSRCSNIEFQYNTSCTDLKFNFDRPYAPKAELVLNNDPYDCLSVDHVLSAINAGSLSNILHKYDPQLSNFLSPEIPATTIATVNLEYKNGKLPLGFGHLIPSNESKEVLGIVYDSNIFPQHNNGQNVIRLTVMLGGKWFEEAFGSAKEVDHNHLMSVATKAVANQLKIQTEPTFAQLHVNEHAIPQYAVNHANYLLMCLGRIKSELYPLTLLGSSYEGIGLNDCIFNSLLQVDKIRNFSIMRLSSPSAKIDKLLE